MPAAPVMALPEPVVKVPVPKLSRLMPSVVLVVESVSSKAKLPGPCR